VKIVLNTNVLVSAVLSPRGKPADLLNLVLHGDVIVCVDDRILSEYRCVLARPIFGFNTTDVETLVSFFAYCAHRVDPRPLSIRLGDPDDIMFYEVLEASGADYLVTGNLKHFKSLRDQRIVPPGTFLDQYFWVFPECWEI
jgi:uncharacterized protein